MVQLRELVAAHEAVMVPLFAHHGVFKPNAMQEQFATLSAPSPPFPACEHALAFE